LEKISRELARPKVPTPKRLDLDEEAKRIEAKFAEDDAHKATREGHQLFEERDTVIGFDVKRNACSCGWQGEWRRVR